MLLRRHHRKPELVRNTEPEQVELPDFETLTKREIGAQLRNKGIEYNKRDTKTELFDLLLGSD